MPWVDILCMVVAACILVGSSVVLIRWIYVDEKFRVTTTTDKALLVGMWLGMVLPVVVMLVILMAPYEPHILGFLGALL